MDEEYTNPNEVKNDFIERGTVFPVNDTTINDIFREQGHGSHTGLNTATLWGIDHENISTYLESPFEEYGLVFFTKPMLNLSYNNILQDPRFVMMASKNPVSMPRIIKAMLDPRSQVDKRWQCPLIDPYNPFIPLLSNTCKSLSGWPDIQMKSYESTPGKYGEVYVLPDGHAETLEDLSITAEFRNGPNDLVGELFHKWVTYIGLVREGTFRRRIGFILDGRRDYDTRAYVITLDKTRRYVTRLTCWGAGFPASVPVGKDGDYTKNEEGLIIEDTQTISINFKAMGALYRNGLWMAAFNRTVENMNPYMNVGFRDAYMIQIPYSHRLSYNKMGYPWIDPLTSELKWYIFRADYEMAEKRRKASVFF